MTTLRLILLSMIFFLSSLIQLEAAVPGTWAGFKEQFVTPDGRVIDLYQQEISHSEGQGYAMLLAVAAGDRKTFDQLWQWTKKQLQVRKTDALHAWSWGKRVNGVTTIIDYNNATDGDICIAWALLLARSRWNIPDYENEARKIIASIQRYLLVERYGKTFLLPGYYGFTRKDALIINPSYLVFPALKIFADYGDRILWNRVHGNMLSLITENTFVRWQLPADWLLVQKNGVSILPDKPPLFGYEAIRVLLWMAWDDSLAQLPGVEQLLDAVASEKNMPLHINLKENKFADQEALAGFIAVVANCAEHLGRKNQAAELRQQAEEKIMLEERNYYSQVLYLLSHFRRAQ